MRRLDRESPAYRALYSLSYSLVGGFFEAFEPWLLVTLLVWLAFSHLGRKRALADAWAVGWPALAVMTSWRAVACYLRLAEKQKQMRRTWP